jgi:hypothetical protein
LVIVFCRFFCIYQLLLVGYYGDSMGIVWGYYGDTTIGGGDIVGRVILVGI